MGDLQPLDAVEEKLMTYLRQQIREHGRTPSYETIAEAMAWSSVRAVGYRIDALEQKGYVRRLGGHRGLEVVGESRGFSLPILGPVAAGAPLGVFEPDGERFCFDEEFGGDDTFMLTVRGDSMIESHIAPGDLVVIRRHPEAEHGEEVVAMVDGAMTLKVYRETRGVKWLFPCNADHKPIRLDASPENRILGVLIGVVRRRRKPRRAKS